MKDNFFPLRRDRLENIYLLMGRTSNRRTEVITERKEICQHKISEKLGEGGG